VYGRLSGEATIENYYLRNSGAVQCFAGRSSHKSGAVGSKRSGYDKMTMKLTFETCHSKLCSVP